MGWLLLWSVSWEVTGRVLSTKARVVFVTESTLGDACGRGIGQVGRNLGTGIDTSGNHWRVTKCAVSV